MNLSVAAIVLRRNNDGVQIFVARRKKGGDLSLKWEFPGGKAEAGEAEQDAIVREFEEEFGVLVRPLARAGEVNFMHRDRLRRLAAWTVALDPSATLELREHLEVDWVSLSALDFLDLADSDRQLLPFVACAVAAMS